ncbi:Formin-like protein 1 [Apostasia shenzhenica]|uniref:Formin-like protein n=1 Tax=Apostasia shenzhenica TaxID=1088818 RepID=A0A2I0AK77_9ASPA|nr:Formin-like protein 1 [Apostasia shenzhenica]
MINRFFDMTDPSQSTVRAPLYKTEHRGRPTGKDEQMRRCISSFADIITSGSRATQTNVMSRRRGRGRESGVRITQSTHDHSPIPPIHDTYIEQLPVVMQPTFNTYEYMWALSGPGGPQPVLAQNLQIRRLGGRSCRIGFQMLRFNTLDPLPGPLHGPLKTNSCAATSVLPHPSSSFSPPSPLQLFSLQKSTFFVDALTVLYFSLFGDRKVAMPTLPFFLLFLFCSHPFISFTHARRVLHHPFFPLSSSWPPAQPPSVVLPKYPFSTNQKPFFPSYLAPPPPAAVASTSSSTLPTFPANISSLITTSSHSTATKLLRAIAVPILSLALLSLVIVLLFLFRRQKQRRPDENDEEGSDSDRLFPPNAAASDSRKPSANSGPVSAEFLYLGTLVNSRSQAEESTAAAAPAEPLASSPELRPLPPLARQVLRENGEVGFCFSSEDEFYSPGGSPGKKGKSGGKLAAPPDKRGSTVSTLSSPSYPSSNAASSPSRSSVTASSPPIGSPSIAVFRPPPPSPSPPRPPLLHVNPSPPKGKPPSPSPPYPPPEKPSYTFSSQNVRSPRSIGDFARNSFAGFPLARHPPPPPPPPAGFLETLFAESTAADLLTSSDRNEVSDETHKPKLKPLHWDKVKASSDRPMVWDQLKSSSFKLNEEMIETLFLCDAKNRANEGGRRPMISTVSQENRVLDPKKAQNIAILLRAWNVTNDEVCEALLDGNADALGNELLETLLRMSINGEEELRLREYNEDSPVKLGPAERFLKAAACGELRSCRLFLKLLEAVLKTGNHMNVGTNHGDAQAFRLDSLLKLVDIKGSDRKTTLLHFVVQEIIRAEGARISTSGSSISKPHSTTIGDDLECRRHGLKLVSQLGSQLSNVKNAASIDSEVLSSYVLKLAGGIGRVREVIRLNENLSPMENRKRFHESMISFLKKAEGEIVNLQAKEGTAFSLVKEMTEYFHGNAANEEAHPFRIFMIIRDFLNYLDQVCKEIGKINERSVISSVLRSTARPREAEVPLVFPEFRRPSAGSSDDEGYSSSS